jgi:farnesyl diphosphate synthase
MLKNNPNPASSNQINYKTRIEQLLESYLRQHCSESSLYEPIKYAALGGGKRIRPMVIYSIGAAIETPLPQLDLAACALELVHNYSLVHDDLPAMDDDDLRRGKPSCHKAFNEATAILTGDAMLALAFEIMTTPNPAISATTQLKMSEILAKAAGPCGIAGGQERDLNTTTHINEEALNIIHKEKTASLFIAAAELTYYEGSRYSLSSLTKLGELLGMAFQLQDDTLEATTAASVLGKPTNSDKKNNKKTHHIIHSLDYAKELLHSYKNNIDKILKHDFADNQQLKTAIEMIFSRVN